MQILVLIFFIYAVKSAYEDVKKSWHTSKSAYMRSADARFPRAPRHRRAAWALRHDAGYWGAQALRGFPVTRHGVARGWHEGRLEQAERRAAREQAKAERLEAEAILAPHVAGYRERQQAAREAARPARAGREGSSGTVREHIIDDVPPDGRTWSWGVSWNPYHWPAADEDEARRWARSQSTGGRPYDVCWYPQGGGPGTTDATYVHGELYLPDPGQRAAWDEEAARQREGDRAAGRAGLPGSETTWTAETVATSPAGQPERLAITQGGTPVSDVTYDGVITSMSAAVARAEGSAAEQQQAGQQASAMADQAQGLGVDPATLSAMADHLDAHDAATRALRRVQETAEAVEAALKRGHAGLAEAHQAAPVQAADREFYQG